MGIIFDKKGVFVEYKEEPYMVNGINLYNRVERPTKLWWELKETIKGKDVEIIVIEPDKIDNKKGNRKSQRIYETNSSLLWFGKRETSSANRIIIKVGDKEIILEKNPNERLMVRFGKFYPVKTYFISKGMVIEIE